MMSEDLDPWGRARGSASRPWTADDEHRLRSMVHDEVTDESIAATLDRTVRSIAIKRQRLGLTIRVLGPRVNVRALPDAELLAELKRRGHRVVIADEVSERSTYEQLRADLGGC